MYKCRECENVFEYPIIKYEAHGDDCAYNEPLMGCPDCGEVYASAVRCESCNGFFSDWDDLYNGWCYTCAGEAFTAELGYAFLVYTKEENAFYAGYMYNAETDNEELSAILKADFKRKVAGEGKTRVYTDMLKAYCLEDITVWIDFLNEGEKQCLNVV